MAGFAPLGSVAKPWSPALGRVQLLLHFLKAEFVPLGDITKPGIAALGSIPTFRR